MRQRNHMNIFLGIEKKSGSHKHFFTVKKKQKFQENDKSVTDTAYVSLAINCTSLIDRGQL